jgi:hypothetical protein
METSLACSGTGERIGEWKILAVEAGINKKGSRAFAGQTRPGTVHQIITGEAISRLY